jgi:hypothetical protein
MPSNNNHEQAKPVLSSDTSSRPPAQVATTGTSQSSSTEAPEHKATDAKKKGGGERRAIVVDSNDFTLGGEITQAILDSVGEQKPKEGKKQKPLIFVNCSYQVCSNSGKFMMGYGMKSFKLCAACKEAAYCGVECQTADWPVHKATCKVGQHHGELVKLLKHQKQLNDSVKNAGLAPSNVPGIGRRRVVCFRFPDAKNLKNFVEKKGSGCDLEVHHLSESYCREWALTSAEMRGEVGGPDCYGPEAVLVSYLADYNPDKEAVVCLQTMLGDVCAIKPVKVPFL